MLKTLFKYTKIYLMFVKIAVQAHMLYWRNFVICIVVEMFYQGIYLAFFAVILSNIKTISGWGQYEIMTLLGIDTLTSELTTAMVIALNTRQIPRMIWSGELDLVLVRPISTLFYMTLGRPYFPSFVSSLTGFVLIYFGIKGMNISLSLLGITGSILFFIFGFIIIYSMIVFFSLMTFFFQDSTVLPRIGERIAYSFTSRPHDMFTGFFKIVFFVLLPVVYVSSFSTSSLTRGIDWPYLGLAFSLAIISLKAIDLVWEKAIKNYSSASS